MIDETKYDAILYVQEPINESNADPRMRGTESPGETPHWGSKTGYLDYYGPDVANAFSFGNVIKRAIQDSDTLVEVADFGPWISVRVTKTNCPTGRSASKTFLIVFQHKSKGIVLSTSNKWRTIDGPSQAASYIRSAASALTGNLSSAL